MAESVTWKSHCYLESIPNTFTRLTILRVTLFHATASADSQVRLITSALQVQKQYQITEDQNGVVVIDQLTADGKQPDRCDVLDELLHMISCKAAVKAGDRLQPEEITALLDHRELCQDSHHCPHGRPTALVFTREELDRRFKRT